MCVITSMFFGLMMSSEEIVKDRKILKRELFLNLSWLSYLNSKILIMFLFQQSRQFRLPLSVIMVLEYKRYDFKLLACIVYYLLFCQPSGIEYVICI